LFASGEIERELDVPDGPEGALHADACLIAQALGNVVRNAIEAMVEAGAARRRLTISARRRRIRTPEGKRAPRLVIAVHDTGPGIDPEVVQRMFNPFFTTRRTGTGLGLAIVHRIVDAHGGHINVRNTNGACVELCLPIKPPAVDAPEVEVLAASSNGRAVQPTNTEKGGP
jgi:signal transduction histidine kinase